MQRSLHCFWFFCCSRDLQDKADIFDLSFEAGLDVPPGHWAVSSTFHPRSDDDCHHHCKQCALHWCSRQHSACTFTTAPITLAVITCLLACTPTQILSTGFLWAGTGPCSYLCSPCLMLNGELMHVWMNDVYLSVPSVCIGFNTKPFTRIISFDYYNNPVECATFSIPVLQMRKL